MARVLIDRTPFRLFFDASMYERARAGWVYVSYRLIPDKARRRALHGALVRLVREDTGRAIHRRLAFHASVPRPKDEPGAEHIVLDWASWLDLLRGESDERRSLHLRVERTRALLPRLGLGHPDPTVRASATLGLLGLVTGLVSLFVSLL